MSKSDCYPIEIQTDKCSEIINSRICSFDIEIADKPTQALFHQQSRFLYIIEGRGKIIIQNLVYDLYPGALVAILPWEYTEIIEVTEALKYSLIIYKFDLINRIIKNHLNVHNEDIDFIKTTSKNSVVYLDEEKEDLDVKSINKKLLKEFGLESINLANKPDKELSSIYAISLILELIVIFYRTIAEPKYKKTHEIVPDKIEIFQYIYMHLSEKITLKRISKIFYMSESSISKYIYDVTGLSFCDLITEMRIGKTINFLLYTDLTLEELAPILGYVDAAHVSKIFSAKVRIKANDYRKTYNEVNDICKIKEDKKSYQIISYIYKHSSEELTVNSVAEKFSITVVKLNQILKYQVEKDFLNFLNFTRINKACKLLLNTNNSITDIAYEVGYNNTKTFNRNFRKYENMNPTDFRKKLILQKKLL